MGLKKEQRKGFLIQALEDGVKKAVELSVITISIGYPPKVILLASAAVFVSSFMFKTVKVKISERSEINE